MALESRLAALISASAAIAEAKMETGAMGRRIAAEARAVEELQGLAAAERAELEGVSDLLARERDSLVEMAHELQVGMGATTPRNAGLTFAGVVSTVRRNVQSLLT